MAHEHRLGRRRGQGRTRRAYAVDPWALETRQVRGDRSAEREQALLPEHHRRDRDERLRHRIDAPDRVALDRQPGYRIALTHRVDIADPATAGDRDLAADPEAALDIALQVVLEPLKPDWIE